MQNSLNDMNSFENPQNVSPKISTMIIKEKSFNYELFPYSFQVIKIKILK
jgi:alpha-L-arabinofuranosidase